MDTTKLTIRLHEATAKKRERLALKDRNGVLVQSGYIRCLTELLAEEQPAAQPAEEAPEQPEEQPKRRGRRPKAKA